MFTGTVRFFTKPVFYVGGGEVMFLMTAQELRRLGVTVETDPVSTAGVPDIVHFFGAHGGEFGTLAHSLHGRYRVPYVVSTVFFCTPRNWLERAYVSSCRRLVNTPIHSLIPGRGFRTLGRYLSEAAMLLPNTQAEARLLRETFPFIDQKRVTVVPNGVEERFTGGDGERFRKHFGITGEFILTVGRLEPRKNQLALIRAANALDLPVVIVGSGSVYPRYAEECRAAAGKNVRFVGQLGHDDPLLAGAFAACRVFALPSIHETPGIAALEAALAGARVVITSRGGAEEYLGAFARYVDWQSTADITRSLWDAWEGPIDEQAQREHVLQYSWKRVALLTRRVYERVLGLPEDEQGAPIRERRGKAPAAAC